MFSWFKPDDKYKLLARLKGHTEAIYSVSVSRNGGLLASGGGDGVRIWDLGTMKQVLPQPQSRGQRGQVSCTAWITRRGDSYETLCYGTGLGHLAVWKQTNIQGNFTESYDRRVGSGAEIICMAEETSHDNITRVAIGTRDHTVQLFTADTKGILHSVFSIRLDATVPITIGFADNAAKDVIVFGLHDGQMHVLRGDSGRIQSTTDVGGWIGGAAIAPTKNEFVRDSVVNGFDLHDMDDGSWKRNFPTGEPERTRPKQVTFGEDAKIVVGGSDHGLVYVFDRRTGTPLHTLEHTGKMVQTLTTHKGDSGDLIVSASSSACHEVSICVWRRKRPVEVESSDHQATSPPNRTPLETAVNLVVLVTLVVLLCQASPRDSLIQWTSWIQSTTISRIANSWSARPTQPTPTHSYATVHPTIMPVPTWTPSYRPWREVLAEIEAEHARRERALEEEWEADADENEGVCLSSLVI